MTVNPANKKEKRRVFNSLDFFIIALILLTLASAVFKTQLASLFSGRGQVTEVTVVLNCSGADAEKAESLAEGDTVSIDSRTDFKVESVRFFEDENEPSQAVITLSGSAWRDQDGVWNFRGGRILTGEEATLTRGSLSFGAWVLEITPASDSPSSSAPPVSTGPIAAK